MVNGACGVGIQHPPIAHPIGWWASFINRGTIITTKTTLNPGIWEELLKPFPGDLPEGANPRARPSSANRAYEELKTVHGRALDQEKPGALGGAANPEIWRDVARDAEAFLIGHAKHFDVALWLCEARLRTYGFAGLRDGLALIAALLDGFSGRLYPHAAEGEPLSDTLLSLSWFAKRRGGSKGTLNSGIVTQPLNDGTEGVLASYEAYLSAVAYESYEKEIASELDRTPSQKKRPAPDLLRPKIELAISRSKPEFLRNLLAELRSVLENFEALTQAVDRYLGEPGPDLSSTIDDVAEIRAYVVGLVGELHAEAQTAASMIPEVSNGSRTSGVFDGSVEISSELGNREAAFEKLLKVAEYFRQSEPQSPISRSIEEVVRRGRLSFADLIEELVPDIESRKKFYQSAGIRAEGEK